MWKLVAVIVIALNGQPVPGSPEIATHGTPFPTEQACKDFAASDKAKAGLADLLASEQQDHAPATVTATMECRKVD